MAREMNLSQTAVARIWRAFGLQPHRQETFKLSSDPLFVEKVRDIVGLYLDPPLKAMVLCVDEKSHPLAPVSRRANRLLRDPPPISSLFPSKACLTFRTCCDAITRNYRDVWGPVKLRAIRLCCSRSE